MELRNRTSLGYTLHGISWEKAISHIAHIPPCGSLSSLDRRLRTDTEMRLSHVAHSLSPLLVTVLGINQHQPASTITKPPRSRKYSASSFKYHGSHRSLCSTMLPRGSAAEGVPTSECITKCSACGTNRLKNRDLMKA